MHDWLTRFWERQGSLRIDHTDLTYGTSILGSDRLFKALSTYFQTYFNPLEPVLPKHIATSNGLSPMIEHVAAVVADPEDAWLIPAPYYNGFVPDLNATSQVRIASVHVPHEKCNTLAEVELMHAEMERRERDSEKQKITALLLTNPHNPLGFCYSREVLLAYCRFAERWNLFLVSDEVYANSVYDAREFVYEGMPLVWTLQRSTHRFLALGQPTYRTPYPLRASSLSMSRKTQSATRRGSWSYTA